MKYRAGRKLGSFLLLIMVIAFTGQITVEAAADDGLTICSVAEDGTALPGTQFTVVGSGGSAQAVSTDENGTVNIELVPGAYTLIQTKVPEGYLAYKADIKFTVTEGGLFSVADSNLLNVSSEKAGRQLKVVAPLEPPTGYLEEAETREASVVGGSNMTTFFLSSIAVVIAIGGILLGYNNRNR